ncbi:hypothetical protein EST38_g8948 [Candolleomyces aberdarensis]|uniref:Uncharacterized protein n=1 Tax=Candolleomyces aberdarensis TaxID=2316362 RepID=A0A4Q2DDH3_9AGAR|nr:hypothetical protein EST38_g8948 [Candolleomyces aberdarensis]
MDEAYPEHVPDLGTMGEALVLRHGHILLLPGYDDSGFIIYHGPTVFTFDPEQRTFASLPSTELNRATKDIVWYTPALSILRNPNPADISLIMSTNIDVNDPLVPRLWNITLSPTTRNQEFDIQPHLVRLREEKNIEFFTFCLTSGRMIFLGAKGKYPYANGSYYLAALTTGFSETELMITMMTTLKA